MNDSIDCPTSEEVQKECRHLRLEHEHRAAALIERLNRAYGGVRNDMKQASKIISEQEQRIEELSAPTSEEVQRVTKGIRESFCYENHGCGPMPYCLCAIANEGADLIERLARKVVLYKAGNAELYDRLAARDKYIEELEKESNEYAEIMAEHLIESDKHDAAMLHRAERAEQRIEELERENDRLRATVRQSLPGDTLK